MGFFFILKTMFFIVIVLMVAVGLDILFFKPEIIRGFFLLVAAIFVPVFAIHRYQSEQRTLRLQKIYFEDALLGLAKSIEEMMSKTTNNMLLTENLYNLTVNMLGQKKENIKLIKDDLMSIFYSVLKNIETEINITDFKKEAVSKLLRESGLAVSILPDWIKQFEFDSYRFADFLRSQILMLIPHINRLNESNTKDFENFLNKILGDYVKENYSLIERHYILFHLLSDVVLEFSSENYATIQEIRKAFKKENIFKITNLINEAYKDVVFDFKLVDVGKIATEDAIRLNERIKCVQEKISEIPDIKCP